MPTDIGALLEDLRAEHAALDERVAPLTEEQWRTPTLATGWDIADCIGHLAYFDRTAVLALTDETAFASHTAEVLSQLDSGLDVAEARTASGAELLAVWRRGRAELLDQAGSADPTRRVPWYGPAMSLASFTTARLMETWAHGQDVADALGLPPVVSDRLRHVCHIGVGARAYAYLVHGVEDSGAPVHVTLDGPGGGSWGPEDAVDRIAGSALDFALLVTQRRHRKDVALTVTGPTAEQWMSIAQAYAGPAGPGREPLT
jgi:uncharacterized protein (TIGR03084 family)